MPTSTAPNDSQAAPARAKLSRFVTRWLTLLTAAVGVVTFALLLWNLGDAAVWRTLWSLSSLGPLLILLELGRLGCELLGTSALLTAADARVPTLRLVRGQLLAKTLDVVMPAGRTAGEAAKATVYAQHLGLPQAAAIATALQLAVLVANSCWAIAGYVASLHAPLSNALRVALLGFAAATSALVLGVCAFAASPRARKLLARVRFVDASLQRFAGLLKSAPRQLLIAVLAQLLGRSLQALQLALLTVALGATPTIAHAAIMQAVYLVGAASGELVPAQLGTTDAAFVLAAPALGLTQASALSASVMLHAAQLVTGAIACVAAVALWWIEARRPRADVSVLPAAR
ncbi:MAG TPA: lysylphosphatidylglycerol synthase domain-containing protein [Polyangiales bacterium]|nr:lysylphosphatidylglycerol synthase domain-containing protein [Polyangiales bacterium]